MITDSIIFGMFILLLVIVNWAGKRLVITNSYWTGWIIKISIFAGLSFLIISVGKEYLGFKPNFFDNYYIFFVCVLLVYFLFENIVLRSQFKKISSRIDVLNTAKESAELEVLKNQLDPHFIFNTLNTLSYLVESETQTARVYLDNLSSVYRYILSEREQNVVTLSKELEFLNSYFQLIRIRHGDAIQLRISIKNTGTDELFIPRMALQLLLENCIKHNAYSEEDPLLIKILITEDQISVSNLIKPKYFEEPTSKTGLKNLDDRYSILLNKSIILEQKSGSFNVHLPLNKNLYA